MFFTEALPDLTWQSSDVADYVDTLNLRIKAADCDKLPPAITLDVNGPWPQQQFDVVFSANSLHIMSSASVERFFGGVGQLITAGGLLLVYGPFKYRGEFTTESNARFDEWLKARDPASGIRDFERVDELAKEQGLALLEDNAMPANNQLLVWQKKSAC